MHPDFQRIYVTGHLNPLVTTLMPYLCFCTLQFLLLLCTRHYATEMWCEEIIVKLVFFLSGRELMEDRDIGSHFLKWFKNHIPKVQKETAETSKYYGLQAAHKKKFHPNNKKKLYLHRI